MQGNQPIQYASRTLTEMEKRYSQNGKEMLSIVYGVTRFHTYTYGQKITICNDHNHWLLYRRNLLQIDSSEGCAEAWNMNSNLSL